MTKEDYIVFLAVVLLLSGIAMPAIRQGLLAQKAQKATTIIVNGVEYQANIPTNIPETIVRDGIIYKRVKH